MPVWALWTVMGTLSWSIAAGLIVSAIGMVRDVATEDEEEPKPEKIGAGRRTMETADPHPSGAAAVEGESTRSFLDQPLHILVVDDDPNLRELLRTSFEVADVEVDEVDSARSAAQKIASRHPDVVVLDVGTPGASELMCRAMEADPDARDIPVVVLPAAARTEHSYTS